MKERQRWTGEEDNILRAYVKEFGPRERHLVSQRMNISLDRDAKSCLERWKNYLKPGIKKGSLTEEEQLLVIHLLAKHGNKWKKIAAQLPGRTAKRLGKWWVVYKEKQQRVSQVSSKCLDPIEGKYDRILENFAEKLVKERTSPMTSTPSAPSMFPPWLATATMNSGGVRPLPPPPTSPSVTLSLASSTIAPAPAIPWLQTHRSGPPHDNDNGPPTLGCLPPCHGLVPELIECCRELDEGNHALASHKKEAAWRLKRVELQLESEKSSRRREIMDEFEAKILALREEQKASLEMIEAEYREQLAGLRRDAEAKEQKMVQQWTAKHLYLTKLVQQIGCCRLAPISDPN